MGGGLNQQQQLRVDEKKEQRTRNENAKTREQRQLHAAAISDKTGEWLREQLREIVDRDQQPDHECARANRLRVGRQVRRHDMRSERCDESA